MNRWNACAAFLEAEWHAKELEQAEWRYDCGLWDIFRVH
jgi:hypothetical protein